MSGDRTALTGTPVPRRASLIQVLYSEIAAEHRVDASDRRSVNQRMIELLEQLVKKRP